MNIYAAIGHITDAPKKTVKEETGLVYINFQMSIPTFEGKTKYEYVPCIAFGKTAETILKVWKDKSQKFGVEGYIVGHTIGNEPDGKTKKKLLKVVIKKIFFAESKPQTGIKNDIPYQDAKDVVEDAIEVAEDDLPF